MRIVDVQSRDIFILAEFSLEELKMLDFIFDNVELSYDSTINEQRKAATYLTEILHPMVKKFIKDTTSNESPN